ncbi:MAG: DNA polymerase Y family protein [Hyphomonadaceae bacterium]|nr:DNA polymerase Y family protein [Hyphomonadaceae bacterium]
MKRYLSLWFPDWPLTRLTRAKSQVTDQISDTPAPEAPFALVEAGPHGLSVVSANAAALSEGVVPDLRFTDAKARCPGLVSEEIDRAADARTLAALGHWMVRFTPIVAIDGEDGLMAETTGCAHLHCGEAGMMDAIAARLTKSGIVCQMAMASTPGAASALARAAPGRKLEPGEERAGLAGLPVGTLRLSGAARTVLRRFGLTRIGQLYGIDRKALARRFRSREMADAVLLRLDQALGQRIEPLSPLRPQPAHAVRLNCPEPISTSEAIGLGLERLVENLCDELAGLGQGARGFSLLAFRADGGVAEARIALAQPARTGAHILRLFDEKIDRIDPGFGIDCLVLEAHRVGPMQMGTPALSGDLAAQDTDPVALAALADRITARLGVGVVRVAHSYESYLPERAERLKPFEGELPRPPLPAPGTGPRPVRIFAQPEQVKVLAEVPDGPPQRFVWRRVTRRVVRADGPERISPEWWRHTAMPETVASPSGTNRTWLTPKLDPRADADLIGKIRADLEASCETVPTRNLPRARDYYRVEDAEGRRYWLFRKGLYGDGRGGAPEWFIHGLFA